MLEEFRKAFQLVTLCPEYRNQFFADVDWIRILCHEFGFSSRKAKFITVGNLFNALEPVAREVGTKKSMEENDTGIRFFHYFPTEQLHRMNEMNIVICYCVTDPGKKEPTPTVKKPAFHPTSPRHCVHQKDYKDIKGKLDKAITEFGKSKQGITFGPSQTTPVHANANNTHNNNRNRNNQIPPLNPFHYYQPVLWPTNSHIPPPPTGPTPFQPPYLYHHHHRGRYSPLGFVPRVHTTAEPPPPPHQQQQQQQQPLLNRPCTAFQGAITSSARGRRKVTRRDRRTDPKPLPGSLEMPIDASNRNNASPIRRSPPIQGQKKTTTTNGVDPPPPAASPSPDLNLSKRQGSRGMPILLEMKRQRKIASAASSSSSSSRASCVSPMGSEKGSEKDSPIGTGFRACRDARASHTPALQASPTRKEFIVGGWRAEPATTTTPHIKCVSTPTVWNTAATSPQALATQIPLPDDLIKEKSEELARHLSSLSNNNLKQASRILDAMFKRDDMRALRDVVHSEGSTAKADKGTAAQPSPSTLGTTVMTTRTGTAKRSNPSKAAVVVTEDGAVNGPKRLRQSFGCGDDGIGTN